jgi:hypothetical protein
VDQLQEVQMNGTPDDGNIAAQHSASVREKRQYYLDGLSDRVRTMCLGSLVLIWGLLTQQETIRLQISATQDRGLLWVAFAAVAVLALDILEYVFGYKEYVKDADGLEPQASRYKRRKDKTVASKLIVGSVALIGLLVVLLSLVTGSARAQTVTPAEMAFHGFWCGGNANLHQSTCLAVQQPVKKLYVELEFEQVKMTCVEPDAYTTTRENKEEIHLAAKCDGIGIDAKLLDEDDLELTLSENGATAPPRLLRKK